MMDAEIREAINQCPAFRRLSHSAQSKLPRNTIIRPDSLIFQIGEAAVIIDQQWVVSIHADGIDQCIAAMAALQNAMTDDLDLRISIEMIERVNKDGLPLDKALEREGKRDRLDRYIGIGVGIVGGGLIALAIGWFF